MQVQILHQKPFIGICQSSLPDDVLDAIATLPITKPSLVGSVVTEHRLDPTRMSKTYHSNLNKHARVMYTMIQDINNAFDKNYTIYHSESLQITKYDEGDFFLPHHDYHNKNPESPTVKRDRIATSILYVNDDFTGGSTFFPELNIEIVPQKGMILLFEYPVEEDVCINLLTLHEGKKVISGTKIIATQWLLETENHE